MNFHDKLQQEKIDIKDPDPWLALYEDQSLPISKQVKSALLQCNDSRSRRILLPLFRPLAKLAIILVQLLRFVIPSRLNSSKMLHRSIYLGLKYFVKPEASYLILRHFNIGSQILKFIESNIDDVEIKSTQNLRPKTLKDLIDDTFLTHDLNIYNFIYELNKQLNETGCFIQQKPLAALDFSAIDDDFDFEALPNKWHNFIDLQTAIELYTPLYGLFLSDNDFWRASNSLQLDETIAIYISKILGDHLAISMVTNAHPMVPFSTLEAGFRLMIHGLDAEILYGFISQLKQQQERLV